MVKTMDESLNSSLLACQTAITLPSPAAGSGITTKNTSEPLRLGGVLSVCDLFLYRDFLSVLEGKDHLVIEDRDPAEQSADVAFVEGDQRSGQTLEKCG